jgi:hypothetical protein
VENSRIEIMEGVGFSENFLSVLQMVDWSSYGPFFLAPHTHTERRERDRQTDRDRETEIENAQTARTKVLLRFLFLFLVVVGFELRTWCL